MRENPEKMRTRITLNTDSFYAVYLLEINTPTNERLFKTMMVENQPNDKWNTAAEYFLKVDNKDNRTAYMNVALMS